MTGDPQDLTAVLHAAGDGDPGAADRLMPLVYDELHAQAERVLKKERRGHTLQPTALVNEVYLRMIDQNRVQWRGRVHFLAVAATMMRRVLINHARGRLAQKRGGDAVRVTLDRAVDAGPGPELDLIALDEALGRLAALDEKQARLVELRFFAGMTVPEAAGALGISERTAHREWELAKAWLHAQMSGAGR